MVMAMFARLALTQMFLVNIQLWPSEEVNIQNCQPHYGYFPRAKLSTPLGLFPRGL
jgi:hypothetical protein